MRRPLSPVHWTGRSVRVLDQTLLPFRMKWMLCDTVEKTARSIETMAVRGAPAIGVTAAYGVALAAKKFRIGSSEHFHRAIQKAIARLRVTRPTAVNLFWALDRMGILANLNSGLPVNLQVRALEREALAIHREDAELCARIGDHGARLLKNCKNVLTHCNTGALATGGNGTALSAILRAARKNRRLHVWVDETRPYLQGARLTAFEVANARVPFHLVTDNMASFLMGQGKVDAVIVGADRIASNGDTANKIGTYGLAVLAKHHRVPFYIAAPTSTFDLTLRSGRQIPIEMRDPKEVTHARGIPLTRPEYPAYNPSFDVTPGDLITAIICEKGVCRKPYTRSLSSALKAKSRS